jgi:hypothetical protein
MIAPSRSAARLVGVFTVLLVVVILAPLWAQPDLPKLLVGRWEGQINGIPLGEFGPNRTLVIKAVKEKDGKWVAPAVYGVTGRGLGDTEITVQVVDGTPILDFVTPGVAGGHKVSLKLVGDVLRGPFRMRGFQREGEARFTRVATGQ